MSVCRVTLFEAGSCRHPRRIVEGRGAQGMGRYPSLFALIEHPSIGYCLFDTGYSENFLQATARFPERLYRAVTPVNLASCDSAVEQLSRKGVRPEQIKRVYLSHFHADHMSAAAEFPHAKFVYLEAAWQRVAPVIESSGPLLRWSALRQGYLPALFPPDFRERSEPLRGERLRSLPQALSPFTEGVDLFEDGSAFAVELPGHAAGQMGLVIQSERGFIFFIADACWTREALSKSRLPSRVAQSIFSDKRAYAQTLERLRVLAQRADELTLVPSHCEATYRLALAQGWAS